MAWPFPRNEVTEAGNTLELTETRTMLRQEQESNLLLVERLTDIELQLEDRGWEQLSGMAETEVSRTALKKFSDICRVMSVMNPLIKRGLALRQAYVFGTGVEISARDELVNEIVQAFLTDTSNKRSLTGSSAQEELERSLGTDGNVFLACFTTPRTGRVEVRSFPLSEIQDIITNPEDRDDPWFYKRQWTQREISADGAVKWNEYTAYYPDLYHRPSPAQKFQTIDGDQVRWETPIYHIPVNRLDGWQFGIGDAFAATAWARAYKTFLEDWAGLVKSLSRFAWKATAKNRSRAQQIRDRLARRAPAVDPNTGRDTSGDAGQAAVMTDDNDLVPIPKTGATIDSESGRPLASMVAAALGVPVTTLLSDPGVTGARAVAETLDKPQRLEMEGRRKLWQEGINAILMYVLEQAVKANKLTGTAGYDRDLRTEAVDFGELDITIDFSWPDLQEEPTKEMVDAIVNAASTRYLPPETIARLLLEALGVEDASEILDDMKDSEGNFATPDVTAALAAVTQFRQGEDPAALLR